MFDNPALLRVNPEYLAWLLSLPTLERERLLGGNWKIRPSPQGHVGATTGFLATDYAKLVTGETVYADGGYHIVG